VALQWSLLGKSWVTIQLESINHCALGVHRGHSGIPGNMNQCVAFSGTEVWTFLGRQGIVRKYPALVILTSESTSVTVPNPKRTIWSNLRWMRGGEAGPSGDGEQDDEPERTPSRTQFALRSHRSVKSVGTGAPY